MSLACHLARFPLRTALRSPALGVRMRFAAPVPPRLLHTTSFVAGQHTPSHSSHSGHSGHPGHPGHPAPPRSPQHAASSPAAPAAGSGPPSSHSGKRHDPLAPAPRPPAVFEANRASSPAKRAGTKSATSALPAGPAPPRGPRAPEPVARDAARSALRSTEMVSPYEAAQAQAQAPATISRATTAPSENAAALTPASTVASPGPVAQHQPLTTEVAPIAGRIARAWSSVRNGAVHYYQGSQELYRQLQFSRQLIRRQLLGYDLTRRERGQLRRTRGDLLRLVVFLPFVIIPFAELLLPVAVKVFPRMLPSTFEPPQAEDLRALRAFRARSEAAHTLARVLSTTALPPAAGRNGPLSALAALRAQPGSVDAATVIKAAQAFEEDSVLHSLPRSALVGMAQFLSLASTGTFSLTSAAETAASLGLSLDGYLRFLIRRRLTALRSDDIVLRYSTTSLDSDELHRAARERGIDLAVPFSASTVADAGARDEALRAALDDWVLLYVEHRVAPTLLVLASAVTAARSAAIPTSTAPTGPALASAPSAFPASQHQGAVVGSTAHVDSSSSSLSPEQQSLTGYSAYLHTLLTHAPGGLDTRQPDTP